MKITFLNKHMQETYDEREVFISAYHNYLYTKHWFRLCLIFKKKRMVLGSKHVDIYFICG